MIEIICMSESIFSVGKFARDKIYKVTVISQQLHILVSIISANKTWFFQIFNFVYLSWHTYYLLYYIIYSLFVIEKICCVSSSTQAFFSMILNRYRKGSTHVFVSIGHVYLKYWLRRWVINVWLMFFVYHLSIIWEINLLFNSKYRNEIELRVFI